MISKRSNTASAKGRDIAPGVPAQKANDMQEVSDNGRVGDAEQALVNQAPAGLGRSGFDPSRIVTPEEFNRFGHPNSHYWQVKPERRRAITIEFGCILRRQYEAGKTVAEIARYWGRKEGVIRNTLKAAGVKLVRTGAAGQALRKWARAQQIVQLHEAGQNLREIGDSFGITRERVRQVLSSMGSEPRYIQRASTERLIAELRRRGVNLRCDSDESGEADKTGTGLAEGDSAGPKGIAQGDAA
jgi:lambda repressor-like predicted transcriptional regulator